MRFFFDISSKETVIYDYSGLDFVGSDGAIDFAQERRRLSKIVAPKDGSAGPFRSAMPKEVGSFLLSSIPTMPPRTTSGQSLSVTSEHRDLADLWLLGFEPTVPAWERVHDRASTSLRTHCVRLFSSAKTQSSNRAPLCVCRDPAHQLGELDFRKSRRKGILASWFMATAVSASALPISRYRRWGGYA